MNRRAFVSALTGGGAPVRTFNFGGSGSLVNTLAMRALADATYGLPSGYSTRDSGTGKNEILDAAGNVIGTGYDDINTTLTEWQRQNVMGSVTSGMDEAEESTIPALGGQATVPREYWASPYLTERVARTDEYGNPVYESSGDMPGGPVMDTGLRQFKTKEEIEAELQKLLASSSTIDQVYGDTNYSISPGVFPAWFADANRAEAIGILANQSGDEVYMGGYGSGAYDPGASNHRAAAGTFIGLPNTVRGDSISSPAVESVSGEHALYGSQPVFRNGNLIGYRVDTRLMPQDVQEKMTAYYEAQGNPGRFQHQVGDNGVATAWNRRSSATANTMTRQLNEGWDNFTKLSDSEYFIPLDKVAEVPGWSNSSSDSYENWSQKTNFFKIVAPIALSFLAPGIGTAIGGAMGVTSAVGTAMIGGAVTGGLSAAITGGDIGKGILTGGVGGAIGGYTSGLEGGANFMGRVNPASQIGGTTWQQIAGGAARGLATGAINGNAAGGFASGLVGSGLRTVLPGSDMLSGLARSGATGLITNSLLGGSRQDSVNAAVNAGPGAGGVSSVSTGTVPSNVNTIGDGALNQRQRIANALRAY